MLHCVRNSSRLCDPSQLAIGNSRFGFLLEDACDRHVDVDLRVLTKMAVRGGAFHSESALPVLNFACLPFPLRSFLS
jgi:hypothetical protein